MLLKLMAYNPVHRISAADALNHPWFKKAAKGQLKSRDLNEALSSMKKFHAGSKLKQAIQGFLT